MNKEEKQEAIKEYNQARAEHKNIAKWLKEDIEVLK